MSFIELRSNQLPRYKDVIRYYTWVRKELKLNVKSADPSIIEICKRVATDVQMIWHKASIPTLTHRRIWDLIRSYYKKYKNIMRSFKKLQNNANFCLKIEKFKESSMAIFDICSCKCEDIKRCICEKSRRVPKKELDFLQDQRTGR